MRPFNLLSPLAQLLHQIGFSLAHFVDGATGLTITVLGIATLFALMQLTGRIRRSEVFATSPAAPRVAPPRQDAPPRAST